MLLHLPQEIRFEIFKYTHLVDSQHSSLEDHAILYTGSSLGPGHHAVEGGKLAGQSCTSAASCSRPLSRSLFLVNRQIYREAQEVFFEYNRFVLAAGHNANLKWLQSLPENCRKRIRRLHIRFKAERHDLYEQIKDVEDEFDLERQARILKAESIKDDDFEDPGVVYSGCCLIRNVSGWDTLLAYLPTQLNLAKLHLAVDLGHIYDTEMSTGSYAPMSAAITQRAVHRIARPLITQLQGRIKSLFIFLPIHFDLESSIEKSVMGADYDAAQYGKIPPEIRCYWRPYAIPHSNLGRVHGPLAPQSRLWRGSAQPKHWGMYDASQGVYRMSRADDFDEGRFARKMIDRSQRYCKIKEICDEDVELVVTFRSPTGEIIVKEF